MAGPMTAREYFCAARDAAQQMRDHDLRREREAAKCGLRARSWESSSHGSVLDAMRHVDSVVDMDAERPKVMRECERLLSEAYEVAGGVGAWFGDQYAEVLCRRFLWLEPWDEVAGHMHVTATHAERMCDMALDLADSEGIARLKDWRHCERRTGAI